MDVKSKFFGLVFLCLAFISSSIQAEDKCEAKGPCKCEFSNGTGIDLTESAKSSFYTAQNFQERNGTYGKGFDIATFYYHPCVDITQDFKTTTNNTCNVPLALCYHVNNMSLQADLTTYKLDMGSYNYLGSSNFTTFSADGHNITYLHGPSQTKVLLVCAETDDQLQLLSMEDTKNITLVFYSKNACLKQLEEPGRSLGSTLCIIFFSLVIFYLVLGVCTKKFLMGATGVEIVPNLGFWTDLPNLVKDGWAFALSGFKLPVRGGVPATSPDPNSYDSI